MIKPNDKAMNRYEDFEKIKELRDRGIISEEEFQYEKQKILNSCGYSYNNGDAGNTYSTYIVFLHLSQFAGFIICGLGFILPIILWLSRSKESREIDMHGKNVVNFMLSMLIYAILLIPLCFIFIGLPFLILLGILQIVFVIIAAVKAANGEYWKYPLSITFMS